ncbi:NAD(P)-binding protein [Tothia fuscella]|uniref:NAD(P)-binding protein n=1 Tax=Tothia fuscella TaxID=1048955 RepID=A0A9P4U316_9PEZI|nr:NAD(P)-binding protein [Tothia fuscella]
MVTGGYAGVGYELVKIFYQKNATVYVAGRSKEKADKAIASIKEAFPSSKGRLEFLSVDFSDLSTIKPAAETFMAKGTKDAHGHELQMGTNALDAYLLSELLLPISRQTVAKASAGSVRVTFAASIATYIAPPGGVEFTADGSPRDFPDQNQNYAQSKTACVFLGSEFAKRHGKGGIISLSWNPGNLESELHRHMPAIVDWVIWLLLQYPARYGAYTELYAPCSPDVTESHNGAFVAPWGRFYDVRKDVTAALKNGSEGGTGQAEKFWQWCEKESAAFK